ncbi:hypothetical protein [Labrys neptuniae]
MGAWDFSPWGNDDAAGWYSRFLRGCDFVMLKREFEEFSEKDESKYDKIRAACYMLQCIGNPYIIPKTEEIEVKDLIEQGIRILSNMIDPPDQNWTYLDMWGGDEEVRSSIGEQIKTLKIRLGEWG